MLMLQRKWAAMREAKGGGGGDAALAGVAREDISEAATLEQTPEG